MFGETGILEPDVTLTDYLLAAQCFCFAVLLGRKSAGASWVLFFGSVGLGSLFGGTVHGFLPDESSAASAIVWRLCLISIVATAMAGWFIGAGLLRNVRLATWIRRAAVLQFAAAAILIVFYSQQFLLAAVNYLPAAIFLLIVFVGCYLRTRHPGFLWGAAGLVLTFGGSFVQIAKIPLHPVYFNHNALYHAIQFVALCCLFRCAWTISEKHPDAK